MRVTFDTSVWVDHLRLGVLAPLLPIIRGHFVLGLDAVVRAELVAGCRNKRERRVVEGLVKPFGTAGRLAVPMSGDFDRAAAALSRLRERGITLSDPGAALLDALIASLAVRTGSLLVTKNESDFTKIASELPVHVDTLDAFLRRVTGARAPAE